MSAPAGIEWQPAAEFDGNPKTLGSKGPARGIVSVTSDECPEAGVERDLPGEIQFWAWELRGLAAVLRQLRGAAYLGTSAEPGVVLRYLMVVRGMLG